MAVYLPHRSKRRENPETSLQRAVLELLHRLPEVAWCHRLNTGAATMANVDRKTGAVKGPPRFVRFGFEGCSDVIGQLKARHGGRFLAIEVKAPGKKPTDDQAAFLEAVRAAGGVAFFTDRIDDVVLELRTQLTALGAYAPVRYEEINATLLNAALSKSPTGANP